jgi:hypothetical protein
MDCTWGIDFDFHLTRIFIASKIFEVKMISKLKKSIFLLLFLQLLLPSQIIRADTGPKPTMEFAFNQSFLANPLTIVSGILYECQQSDCSDAQALQEGGPQGFRCTAEGCDALAYGFAPYHRIEIEFSDGKTRQSNIFQTAGFESMYKVTVKPDDLMVEAQSNPPAPRWTVAILLLCACALCSGVLLVAAIFLVIWRSTRK